MKICLIVNNLSITNGWGRYAYNLINYLQKSGVETKVLCSVKADEENLEKFKALKILPPLFVSHFVKFFYLMRNFFVIKKELGDCDIVHVLAEPYAPIIYFLAGDKPYFITAHGTYAVHPLGKGHLSKIYKTVYKKAKKIICVSSYTKNKILEKVNLNNLIVIPNGVSVSRFKTQDEFVKENRNCFSILSVGVLISRKGYDLIISALAELKKQMPDIKFNYTIIGKIVDEKYYNNLQEKVKENNLENEIVFRHNLSETELVNFYKQSDLFVLVPEVKGGTKFEGFGQVYLEAMACGSPVLAAKNSAAEDFLIDSHNGFLVNPESNEIYKKLIDILLNRELLKAVTQKGKETVLEFDWQRIIKRYINIYDSK